MDGQCIYYGPQTEAVNYFREMGFEPQDRQTSADFLVAITDAKGRFPREGFEDRVPRTAQDFVAHWKKSDLCKRNVEEVEERLREYGQEKKSDHVNQFRESAAAEHPKRQSPKSPYLISYMCVRLLPPPFDSDSPANLLRYAHRTMTKLAIARRYRMQMNDLPTLAIVSVAALFQSLIIGSVYYQMTKTTAGFFSRGGVIFLYALRSFPSHLSTTLTRRIFWDSSARFWCASSSLFVGGR